MKVMYVHPYKFIIGYRGNVEKHTLQINQLVHNSEIVKKENCSKFFRLTTKV